MGQANNNKYICENLSFAAKEAYKRLRTNILFSFAGDKNCHIIGVTSSAPSEGKSVSALNTAYSLAQLGKRTLLIDCDMRKPSIHSKLSLAQTPGLSNLLTDVNSVGSVIQKYSPADESCGFEIMSAGDIPPNPSELLDSERMSSLINRLQAVYSYIILDLPPVGAVSDAQNVSKLTDGILLVVREDHTSHELLDDCIKQLQIANAKILGFVLNGSVQGASKSYSRGVYGNRSNNTGSSK